MIKKEIAEIKKLSQKKHRLEQKAFVAEGIKATEEILSAGFLLKKMLISEQNVLKMLPKAKSVELISEDEMKKLSFLQTPSNVFSLFSLPDEVSEFKLPADELTIILDNIQDPGNLGTIIRLADWFGINTIVCSKSTADCFNPKVVQSTMGAIARVRVIYEDLDYILRDGVMQKIPIYGTFMEGENIYNANLSANGALIMGNEGSGISEPLMKYISNKITIPPFKNEYVESLNVAIATSICCSEFRRRTIF